MKGRDPDLGDAGQARKYRLRLRAVRGGGHGAVSIVRMKRPVPSHLK